MAPNPNHTPFYFCCCQFGAEKIARDEVLKAYPELKFAFSRPGFVTFKDDSGAPSKTAAKIAAKTHHPEWIFVRLWGQSIGQAKDAAAAQALQLTVPKEAIQHAFERDTFVPGDEPEGWGPDQNIRKQWKHWEMGDFPESGSVEAKQWIYDWIWIDPDTLFLGKHRSNSNTALGPGQHLRLDLPESAPSRAYLKIAEAVLRFQVPTKDVQSVLELGCSPGGATSWMLGQGWKVLGVDPKRMHESIHANPRFRWVPKLAKTITELDLDDCNPDWVVMDMNLNPIEAIDELTHALRLIKKNYGKQARLKGGVITLKLNDWSLAQGIPKYLERLEAIGFHGIRAQQMTSNRQEFTLWANWRP
jgi:23S rRNA (cytidine2498-2'-O)-methyltransferase